MNISVGPLAFTTAADDLHQLFAPYSVVDECRVIPDRDTGRSKGFSFVAMPDSTRTTTALAGRQGTELAGRTLTVNEAKPRAGSPAGPAGKYARDACHAKASGPSARQFRTCLETVTRLREVRSSTIHLGEAEHACAPVCWQPLV